MSNSPKKASVVIIGTGTAGYTAALALAKETKGKLDIVMIGKDGGNSSMSHWNLNMDPEKERLLGDLITNLGPIPDEATPERASYESRKKLLEYFIEHRDEAVHGLMNELDIPLKKTGIELKPIIDLPAPEIFKKFRAKLAGSNTQIVNASVTAIDLKDGNAKITYCIGNPSDGKTQTIEAKRVVIASGGVCHTFTNTTGLRERKYPNILHMAGENGVALENMDKLFCHPCRIDDTSTGRRIVGLISPAFTAKADFILKKPDGTRVENFLPPGFAEALSNATYLNHAADIANLFSDLKQQGNEIIMRTRMTQKEFDDFREHDSYGWMFRDIKSVEDVRELNLGPGVHYTMGGVQINESCRSTSHPQVYALGESMSFYGTARPRGFGHIDSIILAPHMAKCIVQDLKQQHELLESTEPGRKIGGDPGPMGRDAILAQRPKSSS